MIEHIRLSEKAKQQLIVIKRKTGIENWNVLCRWALCLSLAEESIPPYEDIQTDSSVEMTWKVFSGDYSDIYISALLKKTISEDVELSHKNLNEHFKLHLHRGISYLHQKISCIDDVFNLC